MTQVSSSVKKRSSAPKATLSLLATRAVTGYPTALRWLKIHHPDLLVSKPDEASVAPLAVAPVAIVQDRAGAIVFRRNQPTNSRRPPFEIERQ